MPADNPQAVQAFQTSGEVEALITEFERGTLPREAWNHRAHLATGISYLRRHGALEGAGLMRGGIQRYNRRVGIGPTDEGAYNETLTLFWLHHVWAYLRRTTGDVGLLDLVNAFVAEYGPKPDLALKHYSEDVLWSTAAKKEWVEPDVRALSPKSERPPFLPPL